MKFDVELTHGKHTLKFTGDASPSIPARMYESNGDPGSPAEGGELDNVKVFVVRSAMVWPVRPRGGDQSLRARRTRRRQWQVRHMRELCDAVAESYIDKLAGEILDEVESDNADWG